MPTIAATITKDKIMLSGNERTMKVAMGILPAKKVVVPQIIAA